MAKTRSRLDKLATTAGEAAPTGWTVAILDGPTAVLHDADGQLMGYAPADSIEHDLFILGRHPTKAEGKLWAQFGHEAFLVDTREDRYPVGDWFTVLTDKERTRLRKLRKAKGLALVGK